MPRIITVDPTGSISRIVRSAMDLLDLSITQVDVPSVSEALEELSRKADLVVSAFELDENTKGFEFALNINRSSPDTSVLILGDVGDPDNLDEETALESPFVYLSRPVDIHQFLRVLVAGLESAEAMKAALEEPQGAGGGMGDMNNMGPVPILDLDEAQRIVDGMLTDLGAMAVIFASRTGEALLERGTTSQIDREGLTHALMPVMATNIGVKDLVGGQVSTIQFYDGDDFDIFVLTVGLHHFLCIIFTGADGAKQFGMVNRFGRRAVEDLIALLGANAFFIQPPVVQREEPTKRSEVAKRARSTEEEPIVLAHAEIDELADMPEPEPVLEPMEPIEDLNLDLLFNEDMQGDESMFDLDNIEEIAKESQQRSNKSALDWDQAQDLGILKK